MWENFFMRSSILCLGLGMTLLPLTLLAQPVEERPLSLDDTLVVELQSVLAPSQHKLVAMPEYFLKVNGEAGAGCSSGAHHVRRGDLDHKVDVTNKFVQVPVRELVKAGVKRRTEEIAEKRTLLDASRDRLSLQEVAVIQAEISRLESELSDLSQTKLRISIMEDDFALLYPLETLMQMKNSYAAEPGNDLMAERAYTLGNVRRGSLEPISREVDGDFGRAPDVVVYGVGLLNPQELARFLREKDLPVEQRSELLFEDTVEEATDSVPEEGLH
jgi:hypothetical protein